MTASKTEPVATMTLELPWTAPPLNLNDRGLSRGAAMAKAAKIKGIRQTVKALAIEGRPAGDWDYLTAQLHYIPRDNRDRDTDNLAATLKPIYDALAEESAGKPAAGLVAKDTPRHMGKPEPIIYPHRKGEQARMWLVVEFFESAPWPWDGTYM